MIDVKQFWLNLMGGLLDKLLAFLSSKWVLLVPVIGPIIGLISFALWIFRQIEGYFNGMMDAAVNASGQAIAFNAGTLLGIANYFIPLDMIFSCTSGLLALYVAALLYRFIKSWIPTVS